MAPEGTTHTVEDRLNIGLRVEAGKLLGKIDGTGPVVGEHDRFLLRENASLWIATDEYIRYGGFPKRLTCTLYLWQEPDVDERLQKDLTTAIKVESWAEGKAGQFVTNGGAGIQNFFDGDLQVNIGPGGALLTHVAGKRTHAHYQFEIVFGIQEEFVWDPDVHDVPPRG